MPPLVEALPASTPMVLFAPRLSTALTDTTTLLVWLSTVEPSLSVRDPAAPDGDDAKPTTLDLVGSLWRTPGATEAGAVRSLEDLARIGIDADAPVALVPDRGGEVVVVILGLSSRKRFETWLSSVEGKARTHVTIGGERASVIAATSDAPVVCLARLKHVYCQVGRVDPRTPVGPLKRLLEFDGPTIGSSKPRMDAFAALPAGAHFYATVWPKGLVGVIGDRQIEHAKAEARFLDNPTAHEHLRRARIERTRMEYYATYAPGAAAGLYPDDDGVRLETQLVLNAEGRRLLAHAVPDGAPDSMIARWARTPSLFSLLVRTHPDMLRALASEEGVELPAGSMTGTFAMMTLGVDAECPSARHRDKIRPHRWVFLLPSAAAVGLVSSEHANHVHAALGRELKIAPRKKDTRAQDRPALTGRAWDSPFHVEVLDDMVLVGTGRGSGAAALRRLGALPPPSPRTEKTAPFLEMRVDLRAVDAAFGAGAFSPEHRTELLALEALRLQMKPLLSTVSRVGIEARKHDDGQRVSFSAQLGR